MFCEKCGKEEATVKYTEIVNGDKKVMHLCEKCSQELGIDNMDFNMPIDFSSFFGDFISEMDTNFLPLFEQRKILKCDICHTTYEDFLNTGKFGCAHCYEAFNNKLDDVLKRIHGSSKYIGKSIDTSKENIVDISEKKKLEESEKERLEKELKKAVEEERYEDAAEIRDKIKKIDK